MPEKVATTKLSSSSIHHEQEQLAQYSYDVSDASDEDYERDHDDDSLNDDDELQDIGELLGFRITGGKDFYMPITIFHVKENSRAEKANLKLGDAILSINGRDTQDMTLVYANRYLAKVADGDVTLQVAKFNPNDDEDDEDVQTIEEVVLEGPESLHEKLRSMQQQLLEMTDIPPQMQSKIAMVTKALEQFMTMDPDALETSSWNNDDNDEKDASSMEREESHESEAKKQQFESIEEEEEEDEDAESTREMSYSFEDLVVDEENVNNVEYESEAEDDDEESKSICESIKSEEALKIDEERKKKNEKIQKLQQSWQKLCENTKTVHKRSNCHLVPSVALLNNKISQLNESKVISFYERKQSPMQ